MKKQHTAVEWFFEELRKHYQMYDDELYSIMIGKYVLAKEMERKQHKATADFWSGNENGIPKKYFEHYYNEAYGTSDN